MKKLKTKLLLVIALLYFTLKPIVFWTNNIEYTYLEVFFMFWHYYLIAILISITIIILKEHAQ